MAKISVIVPVYKTEQYLERCVLSILNQTFGDLELILVDDGSPDNCPALCDEWARKDSRVQVIHKKNGGASSARNAGIEAATGQYIGFVDSDDWIDRNMYERLYQLIEEYDADISKCEWKYSHDLSGIVQKESLKIAVLNRKDCLDVFFRVHGEKSNYSIYNAIYKKSLLTKGIFIEGKENEDVLASYYFATECKKMVCTNEILYHYFQNSSGVTRKRFTKKNLDLLEIWDLVAEKVEVECAEYCYICDINKKRARFTVLSRMYINGYDKKDKEMKIIKKRLKQEVRKAYWDLIRWKMPVSRKILLTLLCLIR